MKNFFQRFKVQIRGETITLPQHDQIAPLIYFIIIISCGFGIANTIRTILQAEGVIGEKKPISNIISKSPLQNTDNEFTEILKRNLFNIEGTVPDASDIFEKICAPESKKSSLAFNVTGILFGGEAKTSLVVLEKKSDNKQQVYKLGDSILPGTKISDISSNRVYITAKYCPEYLELTYPVVTSQTRRGRQKSGRSDVDYAENGFERVGNDTTVTKQWVNDILTNKLSTALEDARAVPYMEGAQVKGFTLSQIVPDSVYSKLGLKNGDVISSINGIELNDAAKAIQTLNSLRSETKIELTTIRDGQPVVLKVNIQ